MYIYTRVGIVSFSVPHQKISLLYSTKISLSLSLNYDFPTLQHQNLHHSGMDFNSLPRKDLQILCKKNNIRANMTNAAMADALQALDTIEGIEDIQQPTMSETAPVLPESPKRTAVRSTDLPRTCGRTSNRTKPIKDLANPIEDGLKYPAESPTPSAPRTRRGAAAKASTARRRTGKEEQEKEEHVDLPEILAENNRSEMPKTPTTRNGRKRATAATSVRWDNETHIKEEKENENRTAVGLRTYSTRRSSRLSEKKMQEEAPSTRKSRGRKAAVKIASLSVESEDSEKESKEGFEKSDVQEDEQGASIKHVSEDRDQDLASEDAATVISVEEASGDNHAAAPPESSLPTESCNLESEKFIEDVELREKAIESENSDEDPTESSDTEDDVAAPDGNQAAVLEFSSPTESCNLESEKCEDRDQDLALGDAATVIPVQDVSGGNRVGVLDSSPRTESSESEKFVEELLELKNEESDARPTESFAAEDDALAVILVEEASSDNHAAVPESSLPTEACNLESEKFIEEDVELREKAFESENSDEDPTESSDTEDDVAAPDGNQAAVLEFSSPTESCNLESEKCDPYPSMDSSVVENQMLEREESDADADRDWYLKDATNEVPGDADLESLASHLVENQVVQLPGDVDLESLVSLLVENLTLASGKCNSNSDASSENSTGNITENQVLESEICDAVEDMGLKSSSDTEIFVEDNNESGNGMTDPSLPSENLNLEYENCNPDADSGLDLGVENAKDFFQDDFPPKNPIEGNNSGSETMAADQILNSEIFNGNTDQDTKLKSIIISTVENLVVEGPENPKHGSDAIPYPHENPNMPATEIDGELPISDHAVSQTPMTMRSNRADASDSGKMSGNKSKSLRLSNKKRTPIRSKILEDADKENSGKMLGNKSNQSLRLSLSNKKWTPIKGKVLENADKENNNVGGDSGKRKPKEFGSLRKVMTAAVVEDVNKGEDGRQRSLDKKSLRRLKIMLKEKIIGNANNESLQKRSALQTLTENCLLGNGDN